jgi:hypothetical protein
VQSLFPVVYTGFDVRTSIINESCMMDGKVLTLNEEQILRKRRRPESNCGFPELILPWSKSGKFKRVVIMVLDSAGIGRCLTPRIEMRVPIRSGISSLPKNQSFLASETRSRQYPRNGVSPRSAPAHSESGHILHGKDTTVSH